MADAIFTTAACRFSSHKYNAVSIMTTYSLCIYSRTVAITEVPPLAGTFMATVKPLLWLLLTYTAAVSLCAVTNIVQYKK